jgi:hypothetical protein
MTGDLSELEVIKVAKTVLSRYDAIVLDENKKETFIQNHGIESWKQKKRGRKDLRKFIGEHDPDYITRKVTLSDRIITSDESLKKYALKIIPLRTRLNKLDKELSEYEVVINAKQLLDEYKFMRDFKRSQWDHIKESDPILFHKTYSWYDNLKAFMKYNQKYIEGYKSGCTGIETYLTNNSDLQEHCLPLGMNHNSDYPDSRRDGYLKWLSTKDLYKPTAAACISSLEKMSEYALRNNISDIDFWHIGDTATFEGIFKEILGNKWLSISDRTNYTVFKIAGQLYIDYLNNKTIGSNFEELSAHQTCNNTSYTQTSDGIEQQQSEHPLLFTIRVNWDLIKNGFAVPESYLEIFFKALGARVELGKPSVEMNLSFNGKDFRTRAYALETAAHFVWISTGGISLELREVFQYSYKHLDAVRSQGGIAYGDETAETPEYLEVRAGDSTGQFLFNPLTKNYIKDNIIHNAELKEEAIEIQTNTDTNDNIYDVNTDKEKIREKEVFFIDFNISQDLSLTLPHYFEYLGRRVDAFKTWLQMYSMIIQCLLNDYPNEILSLSGKGVGDDDCVDICRRDSIHNMVSSHRIGDNLYLNIGLTAEKVIHKIQLFLDYCRIDYKNLIIAYSHGGRKSGTASSSAFAHWLITEKGIAKTTSQTYVSNINKAEHYARINCLGMGKLYGTDNLSDINTTVAALMQSGSFYVENKSNYNHLKAALKNYIEYVGGDASVFTKRNPFLNLSEESLSALVAAEANSRMTQECTLVKTDNNNPSKKDSTAIFIVDFNDLQELYNTQPLYFEYFDSRFDSFSKWSQLYTSVILCLLDDYPDDIFNLIGKSINGDNRADIGRYENIHNIGTPKKISDDLYVDVGMSASKMMEKIKCFLNHCRVDYENLVISYTAKRKKVYTTYQRTPKEKRSERKATQHVASLNSIYPKDVVSWLITQKNSNGNVYSKDIAHQYMSALRTVPPKVLSMSHEKRSVFDCRTVDELNDFWKKLKNSPDYTNIPGRFSVAMGCLSRYLEHISSGQPMIAAQHFGIDIDTKIVDGLTSILSERHPYGFRIDSPIELMKLRNSATALFNEDGELSDEELKQHLLLCGTLYDGKIYVVAQHIEQKIKNTAMEYFNNGGQVIFFSEYYAKNEEWLFSGSVISEDMLIKALPKMFPKHIFTKTYFGYSSDAIVSIIESEVLRIWGDNVLLSYDEIAERLTYIPMERIKHALNVNGDFFWNSTGIISHISKFNINEDECKAIRGTVRSECGATGFTSIVDLQLREVQAHNDELSVTAIYNAVYRSCLSRDFDRTGKIITEKGIKINLNSILKNHCRTIEKCTLDDLLEYVNDLTGNDHRWATIDAGYSFLVRTDKDTFVSEKYVDFDVGLVDNTIESFLVYDYLPLKGFTTFVTFPYCGQPWNLYLLESYCYRFSREFKYVSLTINSSNVGAVVRKSNDMSYNDIIADAVARSSVSLNENDVSAYLLNKGFTGKKKMLKIDSIIDKARMIRERRS